MMKIRFIFLLLFFNIVLFNIEVFGAGKVYLVIGSDTAIWEGMSVGRYHCSYNIDLYTNPQRNAYKVMDPAFRAQFVDSYGQPLKMTWWMMAGNIFRYATNRNIPVPNIMTMYLMQKYHGDAIRQTGDELSLHYHTFGWTDYNGDGFWWWNQTLTFLECQDDFDYTLCQFLLEENVFPVSFRSGWHYMDNDWQHYLDQILPYSMHNDYPNDRTDTTEPLDNTYHWSQSPQEWVPFHPSPGNYQVPENGRGWNVRSAHLFTTRYRDYLHEIFKQANEGIDQVACIWGHLPETDFLVNIQKIDSVAHHLAGIYPDVKFHYCTAIEAMQRWQKTTDVTPPQLVFNHIETGDDVTFIIETDEAIFQQQPFVAVKDIYENYFISPCQSMGQNQWQTINPINKNLLAKAGVAVCDTVGNQAIDFIRFLPDDIYIDNNDAGFMIEQGNWTISSNCAWGLDSYQTQLTAEDTAKAKWIPQIEQPGYYNIFVQVPTVPDPATQISFHIFNDTQCVDTVVFNEPLPAIDWVYVGTAMIEAGSGSYLEMSIDGNKQPGKMAAADVAKFSALVRERDLYVQQNLVDLGEVSQDDTTILNLKISNRGYQDLTLSNMTSANNNFSIYLEFPMTIPGMSHINIPLKFYFQTKGVITDTLFVSSDDPFEPICSIVFHANVQSFFTIIDNEDSLNYREYGSWSTSVAQAYGPSSRYSWLNRTPRASATFTAQLKIDGIYEIFEIVPKTVNASNYAVYVLSIADVVVDSIVIDQNEGSGYWVSLGRYSLPAGMDIKIKVVDTGRNTNPNSVLRADAIKVSLISEISDVNSYTGKNPKTFHLAQNYPNPFNNSTTFHYIIPKETKVRLSVLNLLGQEVARLVDENQMSGSYTINWSAKYLASGIYLYRLETDSHYMVRKLTVIK